MSMQAVALRGFGNADVLYDKSVQKTDPKAREIRICIKAAGFNPVGNLEKEC